MATENVPVDEERRRRETRGGGPIRCPGIVMQNWRDGAGYTRVVLVYVCSHAQGLRALLGWAEWEFARETVWR
jgi:hypothetical protein